jgi:hypothetical protein
MCPYRLSTVCFLLALDVAVAAEPMPVAHWPLAGDARDTVGGKEAENHGVTFSTLPELGPGTSALFDGRSSRLHVPFSPQWNLGRADFAISLWLHTAKEMTDSPGDLVTQYDPQRRVGFNLSLRTNTGVTTCQSNARQLQFGIDAGTEPVWTDVGRPGNAILAFALAVHDGELYAGTCGNGAEDVGHVYRFETPDQWIDCGAPDRANAISALAAYEGRLYAASSKYRFAGSALTESPNVNFGGGIYRYERDGRWSEVGHLPQTEAVGGLVVYNGRLYATSLYRPAGFFRFERDGEWTALSVPDGKRVESLGVFNGYLWATSYDGGRVYRFDGETWQDFGQLAENTQTYSFAVHRGQLCVGTWPSGRVYRLSADDSWEDLGRLGEELEVMGMVVHNGQFYAGTLPLAEVYRYDGAQTWTRTARLDATPDVRYRRAWCMAQHQGRLFCSTLPSGRILAMEAGPCVTYDHELPAGWRHVVAVKDAGVLRLYVDGAAAARSRDFDPARFDLSTEAPLLIGAGMGDSFCGRISDVRLYDAALTAGQVARVFEATRAAMP